MEIILLGENFFIPHEAKRLSSVAVRFENSSEACLFDCGEGTQHYLVQSCLKNRQIRKIIISELNSNSCLGLIGLLATLSLNERIIPLQIYAPNGLCRYLRLFSRYSQTNFGYAIDISSVQVGVICQFSEYRILALPLTEDQKVFGYSILEKERIGKFRISQAQSLKIPLGPLYGELKRRNRLILSNGYLVNGKDLCEFPKRGRKFTYITYLVKKKR
uniref:hypothetical protein n=1 Tax=Rhodaphanes brevistipitata TaxID=446136 RepID=UPI001FCD1633|nr:hypothetical protein MW432_pgp152 [Rhodaphanes brevistipitata]UNJ18429.1 hypothetical protein [Rhodaphanes brevistipitata]